MQNKLFNTLSRTFKGKLKIELSGFELQWVKCFLGKENVIFKNVYIIYDKEVALS